MPRIDPQQLLTCLNVLLSPDGGILSMNEVARLANLMTKFSKKLVSKCIYILILKNTDADLLSAFMGVGGWDLIQLWLQEGIQNKNWALVSELIELLLLTPVDVERLKLNNLPKIVKGLTKREELNGIQLLSTQLVQQWLKIVKDVTKKEAAKTGHDDKENNDLQDDVADGGGANSTVNAVDIAIDSNALTDLDYTADNGYRLVLRDGKQILCKLVENSTEGEVVSVENKYLANDELKKRSSSTNKHKSSSKSSSRDKERSSSSKYKDRKSSSRDKDKDSRRNSSSSHSSSSKHRSSSNSSSSSKSMSRDKDKDRRDSKEKQADKDKDTLAKIQAPSLSKVGRIPKKSDSKREESKTPPKPSFSVEVRKSTEEKPKTVKVFNSKLRSTGLLDEAKPPPPRNANKKQQSGQKRSSPPRDQSGNGAPPPDKRARLNSESNESSKAERPGAIKLIPPKPKPAFLQESDIFMDALAASATKSPKKRKRKLSVSKEAPVSPPAAPKPTETSPTSLKNITPANFYQDTLQADLTTDVDIKDEKEEEIDKQSAEEPSSDKAQTPAIETTKTDINGLKGVLAYAKRKGPKKSIRWKPEGDLVEIQYFELDETERINVTKTFMDMARMEMSGEREALLKSRKLINEDIMDAQTAWKTLHEIDLPAGLVQPGFKSIEKDIQFAREKNVLQALYFSKLMVPDSPADPEQETHLMSDPVSIPLEDAEHADENLPIHSWPDPKGSPPHQPANPPLNIFNTNNNPGGNAFPNFPGVVPPVAGLHAAMVPPFGPDNFMPPPGIMGGGGVEWGNDPSMLMPPVNGMFNNGPPPNFLPNKNVPFMPPQFNNGPGPGGPGFPPPGGFPPGRGRGGHFNNMRGGRGSGAAGSGWVRMSGNNNAQWNRNGPPAGPPGVPPNSAPPMGAKRGRFCNNVKNHGFCRNRDTCPYIHPN